MTKKKFALAPEAIKPLVEDAGACLATDRITVDGAPVGFMYREAPIDEMDSGWRFMAGDESEEYMADDVNQGTYDVNTIANYDETIVPLIFETVGSAFGRNTETGVLEAVESPVDPDDCLHPDYPIVEGDYKLNDGWSVHLPAKYNRRVEEGALVLWRPGVTIYFVAWNNDHGDPIETRMALLMDEMNPDASDVRQHTGDGIGTISFRLVEEEVDGVYGYVVGENGHLQIAFYLDDIDEADEALVMLSSIRAN